MVKGVNKTVLVVNETGNEMFEKIVFYVTPKYSQASLKQLNKSASEFSEFLLKNKSRGNRKTLRRKFAVKRAVVLLGALLFSISLLYFLFTLIF